MRRLLLLVLTLLALAGPLAGGARAQDDGGSDAISERVELIRRLPADEQQRLRDALERFRSLPEERQTALRERARKVGRERLRELVGRNVARLRARHDALDREREEIIRLLGGRAFFAQFSETERAYLFGLALRNFQKHVRRTLLNIAGPNEMTAFNEKTREERRELLLGAVRQLEQSLFEAQTAEWQAETLALSPAEQAQRRRQLLVEHRLTLVQSFVPPFQAQHVRRFLELSEEERDALANAWAARVRWYEVRRVLENELGVSRDVLRLLADLGPEEWSRLRDRYEQTRDLPADERRIEIEDAIREVHGRTTVSDAPPSRAERRSRLRRLLREEHSRRRAERRGRLPADTSRDE